MRMQENSILNYLPKSIPREHYLNLYMENLILKQKNAKNQKSSTVIHNLLQQPICPPSKMHRKQKSSLMENFKSLESEAKS